MKLKYKLTNWLWSTWIGDLYFRYLVWADAKADKLPKFMTPKEMATIIKEHSLLAEGVTAVKGKVNELVSEKTATEYHRVLSSVDNMVELAKNEKDDGRSMMAQVVHEIAVKKGNRDIVTPQDKLNMIHQRIEDYKELHAHIEKRNLYRALRKAANEGDKAKVAELQKTIQEKYGKRSK